MGCCQCQGIEELFSQEYVDKELSRYRLKGPDKTTRVLTEAIKETGVDGLTLLDIGGGVGMVQYALVESGVRHVTGVDASSAYLNAARSEAKRRGFADRISYLHGNFVDLAPDITPVDIVTLDRVICCFDDMERLVGLSAERAGKLVGLVYPRDTWWARLAVRFENLYYRLRRSPFRSFVHPTRSVEELLNGHGLKRVFYHQTIYWQVAVFGR